MLCGRRIFTGLLELKRDPTFKKACFEFLTLPLYNVCSVHWRMFSTLEDVQYIGGCSVHEGERCSVSWRYHKYIEDIMSTLGGGGGGGGGGRQ